MKFANIFIQNIGNYLISTKMKKCILIFLVTTILFSSCNNYSRKKCTTNEKTITHPKPPKTSGPPRILFIGNSQIEYFVSAPTLFEEFCNANNQPINIDQLITVGVSLDKVYSTNKTEANQNFSNKDKDGNYYDYVVIQEATPVAISEIEKYKANVKMIVEKIHINSPDVAVYIYQGIPPVSYTDSDFTKYYDEMRQIPFQLWDL
ncbi:hypothetical protein EV143_107275 [Flavobacterium chryseum]|nr:hypothetical protein EV143_107275 [Flavobacterium sp. P3160]